MSKSNFHIRFVIIFWVSLMSIAVNGQVKFYAQTDARKIINGSDLRVDFVLENADGANFQSPRFEGFDVVAGPSKSSSTTIVNGKMSKKMTYSYTLLSKKIGTFTISPAKITSSNKVLKSQAIMIEVVKGSNKKASGKDQAFVRIELSDSTAYIGQQILLDYKLYTTLDIRNYNLAQEPNFDGFFVQNIRNIPQNQNTEIINGIQYKTQVLVRYALFPQQTGTYEIDGTRVTLGVLSGNANRSRGFFFSSSTKPMYVNTKGVKISVGDIPRNAPVDFSGAIGKYYASFKTRKTTITTDETLVINMNVNGDGDDKMVMAPEWELDPNLEMYDPNIIEESSRVVGGKMNHNKRFEYLITSDKPGRYSIDPSFSYFDTDSSKFITITGKKLNVNIIQGTAKNNYAEEKDDKDLIFKTIASATKLKKKEGGFYGSPVHRGILGLTGFGLLGLLFYKNKLNKSGTLDPEFIKRQNAPRVLFEKMDTAEQFVKSGDAKSFYAEVTLAFKAYLNDKFNIPAVHMKKEEILSAIGAAGMSDAIHDKTSKLLEKSEQALYAPISITDMESSKSWIKEMVDELEAKAQQEDLAADETRL